MNSYTLQVLGIDAAFAHMGLARAEVTVDAARVSVAIKKLRLVETDGGNDRKVVRKSSIELRRARELHDAIVQEMEGVHLAFAEVPSGSQSAAAARALGIAVGVLAALPERQLIEVSPGEVKEVVLGGKRSKKMPTKAEIIQWATTCWPDADWLRHERSSGGRKSEKGERKGQIVGAYKKGDPLAANEHLADAVAAIAAGLCTPAFKLFQQMVLPPGVACKTGIYTARRRVDL